MKYILLLFLPLLLYLAVAFLNTTDQVDLYLIGQDSIIADPQVTLNNSSFEISGYALTAHRTISYNAFAKANYESIVKNLNRYLTTKLKISSKDFSGNVILDIEFPTHLSNLYSLEKADLEKYLLAINLRVRVVKEFFPLAKIGLHAIYSPIVSCYLHPVDIKRVNFISDALDNSYFPNVDFFTVNLYIKYGEKDKLNINNCIVKKINLLKTINNERNIKFLPLISLRVYNPLSIYNREYVDCKTKGVLYSAVLSQISTLTTDGYSDIYIWHPNSLSKPKNNVSWDLTLCLNSLRIDHDKMHSHK